MQKNGGIVQKLLDFGKEIDPRELFPSLEPGATDFALRDPYAFAMATSLDRGTKAEIIWTIPFYVREHLGHLDPYKIAAMNRQQVYSIFMELPKRPRFMNDAPRTVQELSRMVIKDFNGDASKIWKGKQAAEVKDTFRSIFGIANEISSLAVLLIEKAYGIRFSDLDRTQMDIKADVHTMRVLYRLGLAPKQKEEEAVATTRRLHPAYPGELDAPLWVIGRRWCKYQNPQCNHCKMIDICPKIGV